MIEINWIDSKIIILIIGIIIALYFSFVGLYKNAFIMLFLTVFIFLFMYFFSEDKNEVRDEFLELKTAKMPSNSEIEEILKQTQKCNSV